MTVQLAQYHDEPADQQFYGQQARPLDTSSAINAIASVPWVAIALAVHMMLLVIAYFIYPPVAERVETVIIHGSAEPIAIPPTPEIPPEIASAFPNDSDDGTQDTTDQRISADAAGKHNEDPTNDPYHELARNPNDDQSKNESPHPKRDSTTSANGLGGGGGGGGGLGGRGGMFPDRADPERRNKLAPERDIQEDAALEWLRDHQNAEGLWSSTNFSKDSTRIGAKKTHNIEFARIGESDGDKGWEQTCDVGLTGMSLLAFAGAGYDHKTGKFANACRRAVLYLRKVQQTDGCFGPKDDDHFVYNHAISTMAMAEIYGLSGDALLKPIVEKAVDFILRAQNPGMGWRYGVQPRINDSSVTGWMVLALKSCKFVGLEFDTSKCYDNAAAWFKTVTINVNSYPRCGYDAPGGECARLRSANDYDTNPSMDSIYVMSMLFMNKADLADPTIKSLSKACVEPAYLPKWELRKLDYYYWYYASLALFQVGGTSWDAWEKAMSKTLMDNQRGFHAKDVDAKLTTPEALDEHGSWDAVDCWSSAGGRVYATAINCLTLEVYYRYQKQHK